MQLSEAFFDCPYCGETISMLVDHSVADQRYIEDCEVCCQPIDVVCRIAEGSVEIAASRGDD